MPPGLTRTDRRSQLQAPGAIRRSTTDVLRPSLMPLQPSGSSKVLAAPVMQGSASAVLRPRPEGVGAELLRSSTSMQLRPSASAQLLRPLPESASAKFLRPLQESASAKVLRPLQESASAKSLKPLQESASARILRPLQESASLQLLKPLQHSASAQLPSPSAGEPSRASASAQSERPRRASAAIAWAVDQLRPSTQPGQVREVGEPIPRPRPEAFETGLAHVEHALAAARAQGVGVPAAGVEAVPVETDPDRDAARRARLKEYRYVRRMEDPLPAIPALETLPSLPEHGRPRLRRRDSERLDPSAAANVRESLTAGSVRTDGLSGVSERTATTVATAEDRVGRREKALKNAERRARALKKAVAVAAKKAAQPEEKEREREAAAEERHAREEADRQKAERLTALALGILVPGLAAAAARHLGSLRPCAVALASPGRAPAARRCILFLQERLAYKLVHLRQRRSGAEMVLHQLKGWTVAGNLLLAKQRFHRCVVALQRAWRDVLAACAQRRTAASALLLRLDKSLVTQQLAAEDRLARSQPGRKQRKDVVTLTLSERIELRLVPAAMREGLVAAALAAKRRSLRPRIQQYAMEQNAWRRALDEWKESRAACKVVQGAVTLEMPMPPLPPRAGLDESEISLLLSRAKGRKPTSTTPTSCTSQRSRPSPIPSRSPSRSPTTRGGRGRRPKNFADIFRESSRQADLLLAEAGSPCSPNDCPPAENDPQLRSAFIA